MSRWQLATLAGLGTLASITLASADPVTVKVTEVAGDVAYLSLVARRAWSPARRSRSVAESSRSPK